MRTEQTSVYEDMRVNYTIDVLRLLHVSATYFGHVQRGVFHKYL
jgi:hypothetical protein